MYISSIVLQGIEVILGLSEGLLQRGTSVSKWWWYHRTVTWEMSRSTVSKSRADKAKDKDNKGSTSAPAPPVNTDVIPGRFTENDWYVQLQANALVIAFVMFASRCNVPVQKQMWHWHSFHIPQYWVVPHTKWKQILFLQFFLQFFYIFKKDNVPYYTYKKHYNILWRWNVINLISRTQTFVTSWAQHFRKCHMNWSHT